MKRLSLLFVILFCVFTLGLPGCGDSDDETSNAILVVFDWATGVLDLDFDTDGILITDINGGGGGTWNDRAHAVAIQPDGQIVVGGSYDSTGGGTDRDFAVVRFNTDGSLDTTTFGTGGIVKTDASGGNLNDAITALAIQPDGMIVVAGRADNGADWDFAAARYTTAGVLDTTTPFGTGGIATTEIIGGGSDDRGNAMAIHSDGTIVVAGQSTPGANMNFAVVRYTALGVPAGLDGDGIVFTNVGAPGGNPDWGYAVGVQSDGKIVVGGTVGTGNSRDFALIRYNTDGSVDNTFDIDGIVRTDISGINRADEIFALGIQPDGKIVVAGYVDTNSGTGDDFALARYNPDGSLDTTFEYNGIAATDLNGDDDEAHAIAIQTDGRIVVVGYSDNGSDDDFGIVRYTANGMLDTTFGTGGILVTDISAGGDDYADAVAIGANKKIVVVGWSDTGGIEDFAIAVYE